MLYEGMEVRISMLSDILPNIGFQALERAIGRLPLYALPHVSRALIVGDVGEGLEQHLGDGWEWRVSIEQYCKTFVERLPRLRELRLNVTHGHGKLSLLPYGMIATLPELRRVTLSVCPGVTEEEEYEMICLGHSDDYAYVVGMRSALAAVIKDRAKEAGKAIEILEARPDAPAR